MCIMRTVVIVCLGRLFIPLQHSENVTMLAVEMSIFPEGLEAGWDI